MRKRFFIVSIFVLVGSFLLGLTLMQERNAKVVVITTDGKPLPLYNASYELVIGVTAFTNGWPILPEATNDARGVKLALATLIYRYMLGCKL